MGKLAGKKKASGTRVVWKENESSSTRLRKKRFYDRELATENHARADQILEEMKESCQRIDRLLKVFDRIA